jgi:hypothetical protein
MPRDADIPEWTLPGFDDSSWERIPFGIWSKPGRMDVRHAILRKTVTVPKEWIRGTTVLWLQAGEEPTFMDEGRVWIDGRLVRDWSPKGLGDVAPPGGFRPGERYVVTIEIRGRGVLAGARANVWLWHWPEPAATLDLAGSWESSQDMLRYEKPVTLPGSCDAFGLRRAVLIPASQRDRQVYVDAITESRIVGVLINGRWVRRFYHGVDEHLNLNVTPWVKFGEVNDIQMVSIWSGPSRGTIRSVRLEFHENENIP